MVRPRLGVVGASGFGGAELLRLLARHPGVEVVERAAAGSAGRPLGAVAPGFPPGAGGEVVLTAPDPERLATLDLVLLATPDDVSLALAPALVAAGTRVVDLSGAFRLTAADSAAWYGRPHTAPVHALDGAEPAVYGLTEWSRAAVAAARLVANPGCYPTATLLGLRPLAGLLEAEGIVVNAVSGTSGAGRTVREDLQASVVLGDVVAYGAPSHRHTIEIETHLAPDGARPGAAVVFTPHLVPVARGMLVTASAVLRPGVTRTDVDAALAEAYAGEPFVHVLASGTFPRLKAVHGSNACLVAATVDERTGRVLVTTAIDNLGKGAAGQAIQNANLMLGLDEGLGLETLGVWP